MIGNFHFIRPGWLLAFAPVAVLLWAIRRRQDAAHPWQGIIAPHLLPFLLGGQTKHRRAWLSPLLLIGIGWALGVLAIAGPAWRREPSPFADDTAALAIVVKVTPSMMTEDVQPNRLARGVQKIHDLLALRRGARASLVAYAGTAHVVMPMTTDETIIGTFAQALDPKIMPGGGIHDGDASADALRLADRTLAEAGAGSILWIADAIAPEETGPLASWRKQSPTPLSLLAPLPEGRELDGLSKNARAAGARLVPISVGGSDIDRLARAAKFSAVQPGAAGGRWQEAGYWLTPLLALLLLPFFRKGWMAATASEQ